MDKENRKTMKTPIIYSEKCLGYGQMHIEGPARVKKAYEILKERGYKFVEPTPATEEQILKVHDKDYIQSIKDETAEDEDTPAYKDIYEYARLAAGGAILAANMNGFSLLRPPGHHAGRFGVALGAYTRGFCYINNLAVAVKTLGKKTLILDIDGHHGNGTQEIFFGDKNVVYISLHRYPTFPHTGTVSEGNCYNFLLPGDCGERTFLRIFNSALDKVDLNKFEVVAVSAGFDTHKNDLASLGLIETSYWTIGKRIAQIKKPTFFVFEGGYEGEDNGKDIDMLLRGYEENLV